LWSCTDYAIKHKRSILLTLYQYSATDITKLFDLSKYPVPLITDAQVVKKLIDQKEIEPSTNTKNRKRFNTKKTYPRDVVLLWADGGGGPAGNELNFFRHVRLQPAIVERYNALVKKMKLPAEYVAAHLRDTDKPLSYNHNIVGMSKSESNHIKKNGDIEAFIEKAKPLPVYIATDNKQHIESLKKKYPGMLHSDAAYKFQRNTTTQKVRGLHHTGKKDQNILIDAVLELIILAKAKMLMPSTGGYTEMAKDLWKHKNVVEHLLRK